MSRWITFKEARSFVQSQHLKSVSDWFKWSRLYKPKNIPATPNDVYKSEWVNWGDWLGTGVIANKNIIFLPFKEARDFIRNFGFKDINDWYAWIKTNRLSNIPTQPYDVYKSEWVSWQNWFGTEFLPFKEAREFVRNICFKSRKEYINWCKNKPINIPSHPEYIYKLEWQGWGNWLGNGNVHKKDFLQFNEAREFVRKLVIKDHKSWVTWAKSDNRPENIPSNPIHVYKSEWVNWGDWLGTSVIANKNIIFLPFDEAREFVRNLNLKNKKEFDCYNKDLKINIEYDGIQHYEFPNWIHKTKEQFDRQQRNDKFKDLWCINNCVLQIRVCYKYDTKDKIKDYIENQLSLYLTNKAQYLGIIL
jgi:hypothetical protein